MQTRKPKASELPVLTVKVRKEVIDLIYEHADKMQFKMGGAVEDLVRRGLSTYETDKTTE